MARWKFTLVPRNVLDEIRELWGRFEATPLQAMGGLLAFSATIIPLVETLTGRARDGDNTRHQASDGLISTLFSWLVTVMTSSVPMRLVTCLLISGCIGWTWSSFVVWLTRSAQEGRKFFALVLATFFGFLVSAWTISSLRPGNVPVEGDFPLITTVAITTVCIALSVLTARVRFRLTHETSMPVIERRAHALALFAFSATAITLVTFINNLAGAK